MHLIRLKLSHRGIEFRRMQEIRYGFLNIIGGKIRDCEIATRQIWFRGSLYYIVPLLENYIMEDIEFAGQWRYNLSEELHYPGKAIKIKYGNRRIFDPRTFGQCGWRYKMHEIADIYDTECTDCSSKFINSIPPIVGGRMIMHLGFQ